MRRHVLYLSGEHPDLPWAEALSAFDAQGVAALFDRPHPRLVLIDTDADRAAFEAAVGRLALTHEAGLVLAEGPYDEAALGTAWSQDLPKDATVAARATRLAHATPWRTAQAEGILGAASGRRIDLTGPTAVLRAFLLQDRLVVAWRWTDRDPAELAARHVKERPFFSPVSLEPKWARTLLNLARLGPGDLVVDPLCGTGGVLLEAAAMGFRGAGADLDPEMVEGTRRNLAHFGFRAEALVACDVAQAPRTLEAAGVGAADAVVTDLPYGRSASTGREARRRLYARAASAWTDLVRPGGRVVLGVPTADDVAVAGGTLRAVATYAVRVHRSLTRHFAVFERPDSH